MKTVNSDIPVDVFRLIFYLQIHLQPKLLQPALLLPSERIVIGGLRVFLLADGRVTSTTCGETPQSLLPAEGAIFLTNYRVVFKGQPCDLFRMFMNCFTFFFLELNCKGFFI